MMFSKVHDRPATLEDLEVLQRLIGEYATGHPAERRPTPLPLLQAAFFGPSPASQVMIAVKQGAVVGFGSWHKIVDLFWGVFGGEIDALYVNPEQRGRGIAVS